HGDDVIEHRLRRVDDAAQKRRAGKRQIDLRSPHARRCAADENVALHSLFVVRCSLFVVSCWLFVVGCSLFVVGCWLFVVGCWLFVVRCWLFVVGCWLFVVGCWLFVVGCWLFVVRSLLVVAVSNHEQRTTNHEQRTTNNEERTTTIIARMTVSVVIPAVNEEEWIAGAVESARGCEVIVVDGGSTDRTARFATAAGARVLLSDPPRGRQLNRGAEASSGDWIVFLHADSRLPDGFADAIEKSNATFGGFRLRFAEEDRRLRVAARMINLRTAST